MPFSNKDPQRFGREKNDRGGELGHRDFGERSYGNFGRGRGPGGSAFGRDEGYFGGNLGEGYGGGHGNFEPNSAPRSSWRDSTGYSNYDYPERRSGSFRGREGFGRDAYGLGYKRQPVGRSGYGDRQDPGYYGRDAYQHDIPESERGFYSDRGNDRSWWDRAADEFSSWFGDDGSDHRRQAGERPSFRGRGPKNYTRSDDRIREDINDRLTDYDYIDASDIEVEVKGGEVVLSGSVDSRFEKRLAEDIAEDVSGVKNVENRIRVRPEKENFASGNWGYGEAAGHTELNRSETDAAHGQPPDRSRSAERG